jgi:trk system potassium uptake protein TrkA
VRKGDKILKPSGSLRIEEGDHVVLFSLSADVAEVERLLQVTIDFF